MFLISLFFFLQKIRNTLSFVSLTVQTISKALSLFEQCTLKYWTRIACQTICDVTIHALRPRLFTISLSTEKNLTQWSPNTRLEGLKAGHFKENIILLQGDFWKTETQTDPYTNMTIITRPSSLCFGNLNQSILVFSCFKLEPTSTWNIVPLGW